MLRGCVYQNYKKIKEMTIYVKENSYVWQRYQWRRSAAFDLVLCRGWVV
jgi:hypothetical protein